MAATRKTARLIFLLGLAAAIAVKFSPPLGIFSTSAHAQTSLVTAKQLTDLLSPLLLVGKMILDQAALAEQRENNKVILNEIGMLRKDFDEVMKVFRTIGIEMSKSVEEGFRNNDVRHLFAEMDSVAVALAYSEESQKKRSLKVSADNIDRLAFRIGYYGLPAFHAYSRAIALQNFIHYQLQSEKTVVYTFNDRHRQILEGLLQRREGSSVRSGPTRQYGGETAGADLLNQKPRFLHDLQLEIVRVLRPTRETLERKKRYRLAERTEVTEKCWIVVETGSDYRGVDKNGVPVLEWYSRFLMQVCSPSTVPYRYNWSRKGFYYYPRVNTEDRSEIPMLGGAPNEWQYLKDAQRIADAQRDCIRVYYRELLAKRKKLESDLEPLNELERVIRETLKAVNKISEGKGLVGPTPSPSNRSERCCAL